MTADRLQNHAENLNQMKGEARKFEDDLASVFSKASNESEINTQALENVLDFKITQAIFDKDQITQLNGGR